MTPAPGGHKMSRKTSSVPPPSLSYSLLPPSTSLLFILLSPAPPCESSLQWNCLQRYAPGLNKPVHHSFRFLFNGQYNGLVESLAVQTLSQLSSVHGSFESKSLMKHLWMEPLEGSGFTRLTRLTLFSMTSKEKNT